MLNNYKTNKTYGFDKKIDVSGPLATVIRAFLRVTKKKTGDILLTTSTGNAISRNVLSQMLIKTSQKYIGKSVSTTMMRKIVVSHELGELKQKQKDLTDMLPEVENFTINELIPALSKGGFLDENKRKEMAKKIARYSGLSEKVVLQNNLDVPFNYFWKELVRDEGFTVGRLDSRYKGIDRKDAGDSPDFNSELTSWLHSFTPAINHYIRKELNFKTDMKYNMFGLVRPWNNDNDNTRDNLRQAMAQNPYLEVLIQSGYYDGATTYFNAKYTQWQVDPSGKMKDRFHFEGYRSGHMMYLRREDLIKANEDIRVFIKNSAANGKPAKY